jgi:hypothetical protein
MTKVALGKRQLKKSAAHLFVASLIYCVGTTSSLAYVAMPKIDVGNIGARVIENAMTLLEGKEMQAIYKGAMEAKNKIKSLTMDNDNSVSAIKINTKQKMKEEISKKEELKASQPGVNACSIIASVVVSKKTDCAASDFSSSAHARNSAVTAIPEGGHIKNKKLEEFRDRIAKAIDESDKIAKSEAESGVLGDESINLVETSLSPFYLLSSDKNTYALDENMRKKMEDYVFLIAPPYIETKQEKEITDLNNKTAIIAAMKRAMMNVPNAAFNDILSVRISGDDESESKLYARYNTANSYFSFDDIEALNKNKDFVDTGALYLGDRVDSMATRIALGQLATPDVVIRNIAIMKALKISEMLESYKVSLNKEIIMATMLAKKINMI